MHLKQRYSEFATIKQNKKETLEKKRKKKENRIYMYLQRNRKEKYVGIVRASWWSYNKGSTAQSHSDTQLDL